MKRIPQPDLPKIKILHQPFTQHGNHRINKMFRVYNEFLNLTFRSNDFKREIDIPFYNRLNKLAKYVGIQLPPRRFLAMDMFKNSSRKAMGWKEQLWYFMTKVLNEENDISATLLEKDKPSIRVE